MERLYKDQGAVAQAKNSLARKAKAKRGDLEKLFDGQIATLKNRGCPERIIEMLENCKGEVLNHAESITIVEGNLAFAPVITPLYLGYYGILSMVRHNGRSGYTRLDPASIEDVEKVPVRPYYHFDIEAGTKFLDKHPEVSDKLIWDEKRLCSTAAEIVSIGTHTDVLSSWHYMAAIGSRYGSDQMPLLYLCDGRPELSWISLGLAYEGRSVASCGSRLEL